PFEVSGAIFDTVKKEGSLILGSTMIVWQLTIIKPGPYYGKKLKYTTVLSDKAMMKDADGNLVPNPDAARQSNYYLRENFLKVIGAPWDKVGFATEDAYHCRGIAKVSEVMGASGDREFNQVDSIMPFREEAMVA